LENNKREENLILSKDQRYKDGFLPLATVERNHILKVLQKKEGNKSETARILGISRSTLRDKLNRYRVNL
jgi:DNA-binding NtrC family response regulator